MVNSQEIFPNKVLAGAPLYVNNSTGIVAEQKSTISKIMASIATGFKAQWSNYYNNEL